MSDPRQAKKPLAIENNSHNLFLQTLRRSDSETMYICICNAIREADLRDAAVSSGGDAVETYASLGKKPNCGQCLVKAQRIIHEHREGASCDQVAV